jgi:DNA-binding response OmpR family regulator
MKAKCHFTIVDDDPHILFFVEHALRKSFPHSHIVKFSDGSAALRHIESAGTDLVVTDHSMPTMNGADLIRELRMKGHTLPIVMVSNSPDAQEEGTRAGATVFINKGHVLTELGAVVERLLALHEASCS